MNNLVTFLFCLLEPIVNTTTDLLPFLKVSWLHLGDEGSKRERKLGSYVFVFHLTDILDLLVHY